MGNQDSYASGYRDGADGKPNLSLGVLYEEGWSDGYERYVAENDTPEQLAADIQDVLRTTRHEGTETFYITFGSQYTERNVKHPQGMSTVGYFVIEAPDEMVARAVALAIFDTRWSMIYTHADFWHDIEETERWYPAGELGRYKLLGTDLRRHDDEDT